jgi:hypothetical protein
MQRGGRETRQREQPRVNDANPPPPLHHQHRTQDPNLIIHVRAVAVADRFALATKGSKLHSVGL